MINLNNNGSEKVKYDYADFPIYVRRCPLSAFPNFTADRHWHDDIELIYALSGKIKYNINGQIVTINKGEGIIVNSRQLHFGFSDTKDECDFICILFHPVTLCSNKMFEQKFVNPIINSDLPFIRLQSEPWQKNILNCIYKIWETKESFTAPLFAQGLVCLIWKELSENLDLPKSDNNLEIGRITTLKKMMTFIQHNHREKLTLAEIANAGGTSKRTCEDIFMNYLNQTPIEYLRDYRLRKSTELLTKTDLTVLEISMEVGFSGASYYAESFRKAFGTSPAQYRKNLFKER